MYADKRLYACTYSVIAILSQFLISTCVFAKRRNKNMNGVEMTRNMLMEYSVSVPIRTVLYNVSMTLCV